MTTRPWLLFVSLGIFGCGSSPMMIPADAAVDSAPAIDAMLACDPFAQPANGRCTINHNSGEVLVDTTAGTQGAYQTCMLTQTSDNCNAGFACEQTGTVMTCRKFCRADTDCAMGDLCALPASPSLWLHVCAQGCSVLDQANGMMPCTTMGEACYIGNNVTGMITQQCSTAGGGADGSVCMHANDCMPGLVCVSPTGTGGTGNDLRCHPICNTMNGMRPMCAGPATCHAFTPAQGNNAGYCL